MRSPTPNLDQHSDSIYELNLLIALSRRCTQHHHSHRLVLLWPGPGGHICKDLNSLVVQAEHLRLAQVVALQANLNSKLKEAMDSPCQEDRLIREMDRASHCGRVLVRCSASALSPASYSLYGTTPPLLWSQLTTRSIDMGNTSRHHQRPSFLLPLPANPTDQSLGSWMRRIPPRYRMWLLFPGIPRCSVYALEKSATRPVIGVTKSPFHFGFW